MPQLCIASKLPAPPSLGTRLALVIHAMASFLPDRSSDELVRRRCADWLLATAAHELKNPLFAMRNIVDLLLCGDPGPLSAAQERFLRAFRRNLDRLTRLVEGMLDVSRSSEGKLVLARCWVDTERFVHEVVESFEALFNVKGVRIAKRVEKDLGRIYADPARLEQILVNLLGNAVRFVSPGGRVDLEIESGGREYLPDDLRLVRWEVLPDPRFCSFNVTDDGIGMSDDTLAHLFTRYHDPGTKNGRQGAHLGLNISRELVRAHGGELNVESTPGVGTRVRFFIPADERTSYILECFGAMRRFLAEAMERKLGVRLFVAGKESGECWLDLCRGWGRVPRLNPGLEFFEREDFFMWPLSEYLAAGIIAGESESRDPLGFFGRAAGYGGQTGCRFDGYAVGLASAPRDGVRLEQLFNVSLGRMEEESTGVFGRGSS